MDIIEELKVGDDFDFENQVKRGKIEIVPEDTYKKP